MDELVFLDINSLKLPDDVVENSGLGISFINNDKVTGEQNEIIVITQFGRSVGNAFLCHLESPKDKECIYEINDIPGYPVMKVKRDTCIREFGNMKYTMVCVADKDYSYCRPNWLY